MTEPRLRLGAPRWGALLMALSSASVLCAHDTFLRVPSHGVAAGEPVEIAVFHGTFDESVLMLETGMVRALVVSGPAGIVTAGSESWRQMGYPGRPWAKWQGLRSYLGFIDMRLTSNFTVTLEADGTHVVAVELNPGGAAMSPATFLNYLHEEGLDAEPIARQSYPDPNAIITERYIKYTKIILQAGETKTPNVTSAVAHAVEIVPLVHPLDVRPGGVLPLQLLLNGQPLAGQVMLAGRPKKSFGRDPGPKTRLRSDAKGQVALPIDDVGVWWLSFVHIVPAPPGDEVMYDSKWATVTFEIR